MGWLDRLLDETDDAETPRSYIYWAGLSAISAVISPNVWINRKYYLLSPNLFVMLIGESGLGKGLPVAIARRLVKKVDNTRVISGSNTIQSIIQELGTSKGDPSNGGAPKFKDARGFIVSGEFANLLSEDKKALSYLTELYDTHYAEDWKKSTKNSGNDQLTKVCITLLGGSTPEHFTDVVPDSDVKGGFVGRILTVYEEKRYRVNPLSDTEAEFNFPYDDLAIHLREISRIEGPFRYTPEARAYWDEWYADIRTRDLDDPTGAVNRLPDNVLKVAMCIALSRRTDLLLYEEDIEEAKEKCMTLTIDTKKLTGGRGKSASASQTHFLMKALWRAPNHALMKTRFLSDNYGMFDIFELDKAIQTLTSAGLVKETKIDSKMWIILKPEAVENIKKWMESKQ